MAATFQKTTLPDGLRVLTQVLPGARSVTLGVWLQAGSVFETPSQAGLAHLLEHMVFKGTRRHSMLQIAARMDEIGGGMNAFTDREWVCYHVKVLPEHVGAALQLLGEFVTQPLLDEELLAIERDVVLEEIRGTEDVPDELVGEIWLEKLWPASPWGVPIAGRVESVAELQAADLRAFMSRFYTPGNCVLAAVGAVEHLKIVKAAQKYLSDWTPHEAGIVELPPAPQAERNTILKTQDTESAHLILGAPAYASNDPKRFAARVLEAILTGGYSSRLFQEIREKRGLCYSISGSGAAYRTAGFWTVETSVSPHNAKKTIALISRELRKVKQSGVKPLELKRAKQMARVNLVLAEESAASQMSRLAQNEWIFGEQKSTEETLASLEAVTLENVQSVAREMFDAGTMNLAAIGPFSAKTKLEVEI